MRLRGVVVGTAFAEKYPQFAESIAAHEAYHAVTSSEMAADSVAILKVGETYLAMLDTLQSNTNQEIEARVYEAIKAAPNMEFSDGKSLVIIDLNKEQELSNALDQLDNIAIASQVENILMYTWDKDMVYSKDKERGITVLNFEEIVSFEQERAESHSAMKYGTWEERRDHAKYVLEQIEIEVNEDFNGPPRPYPVSEHVQNIQHLHGVKHRH